MKVLFVATEMYPLAKVGGLADVVGILPKKLKELGCDVRVIIPFHKQVKVNLSISNFIVKDKVEEITVNIGGQAYKGKIKEVIIGGITVYLLVNDELFDREYIYSTPDGDYDDNDARFGFLSLGALKIAKAVNFKPDIIHCHDWHTALLPILLKWRNDLNCESFFKDSKVVFTIHNISYQGLFEKEILDKFNLPQSLFTHMDLEFYGKVNLMKGGILYSNLVTTVSPTYAQELKTPQYGCGLDGVFRSISGESGKFAGILNEIDHVVWNPKNDSSIYENYGPNNSDSKSQNKLGLQRELGLDLNLNKPLIGMVSRLTEQKGVDLVVDSLRQILNLGFQVIILGSGEERYERMLKLAKQEYGENFSLILKSDGKIVRRVYAGSDIFLMPSRFEPCGIGQMIALRYGSIPVARGTGGLLDTIRNYRVYKNNGNGFLFNEFSKLSLLGALIRAMSVYQNQIEWQKLVRKAMAKQFFWTKSSKIYFEHYRKLQKSKR
ncbi:MAG: glycogen synthase GlgA [Thermodesulfobacteriota bacterium]